jgi:hypothetical protein
MTAYDPNLMKAAAQISKEGKHDSPRLAKPEIEWAIALAARDAAKAAYDLHHETVYRPLADEFERTYPRPSQYFEITAQSGQTARYFVPANDLHQWDNHMSSVFREKSAVVRDAWLDYLKAQEQTGYDAINDESDRLCEVQCNRESDLIVRPAPHASALLWKLEHLFGPESREEDDFSASWCADWINAVMIDARRLLGAKDC